ncbi:hypothetical protein [Nonomuraea fuscirosea]|uniref:hypothetical protein n=1 Tax=Nonomuraea fuscirosea TaxID=1291556 RepID=UPI00344A3A0F
MAEPGVARAGWVANCTEQAESGDESTHVIEHLVDVPLGGTQQPLQRLETGQSAVFGQVPAF